jgi:sucrose-6-phosphate hydrolase SacC (GH32 family)
VKTSDGGRDWWTPGTVDPSTGAFAPLPGALGGAPVPRELLDAGHVYASKSYADPTGNGGEGRRVLWGWVSEEDEAGAARGWQGMQTLPRVVSWDAPRGVIAAAPIPELAALRGAAFFGGAESPTPLPLSVNGANASLPFLASAGGAAATSRAFEIDA